MEEDKINLLEKYLAYQMLQLSLKFYTINKASKNFDIPKDTVKSYYFKVRKNIKVRALKRALIYLIIGSITLFIGVKGTFGESSKIILYGALLVGLGSIATSLGLFVLAFKGFVSLK
ncbi:hypothetical protein E1J38_010730 [Seonamhaeicola sediminis]|uniref:Uncharacterized protein n=1 Tax=Seonamhaeicola sediminis TaxID=2528206 RepID=A0A562YCP5_9FLAO|nr:hypothetical protein [Seonamhaeicola sediminis]TWO32286.1 hypothetical protein E1J38_010730 [Seonamhaeicola sediminis]